MLDIVNIAVIIYVFVKIDKRHIKYAFIPLGLYLSSFIFIPLLTIFLNNKDITGNIFGLALSMIMMCLTFYFSYYAMNKSDNLKMSEVLKKIELGEMDESIRDDDLKL